ncbi:glucose-6-phosphate dehydrogenase, partial [Enterococcus faecium]
AQRILNPSLFRVYRNGNLGEHFAVIGTARRPWSDEHYREVVKETIRALNPSVVVATTFASHFYYQSHDVNVSTHYQTL